MSSFGRIARTVIVGSTSMLVVGVVAWWLAPTRYEWTASAAADADFLHWPTRGDLASDRQVIGEATDVWGRVGKHHDVHVLWAGTDPRRGVAVILQGRDTKGQARLGILTGGGGASRDGSAPLWLRDDRPVPDPGRTHEISLLSRAPQPRTSDYRPMDIIVLAEPGAYVGSTQSYAWQHEGQSSPARPFLIETWQNATPHNFTIRVTDGDGIPVYSGEVDRLGTFDRQEPAGGTVDSVAVWYLPNGFRLAGKLQPGRIGGVHTMTARYEDESGAFVTVTVARGANANARLFDSTDDQSGGEHSARGRIAHVAKQVDGALRYTWEERPGLVIAVTGTEPKSSDSVGKEGEAVPVVGERWTVAEIADALQPMN